MLVRALSDLEGPRGLGKTLWVEFTRFDAPDRKRQVVGTAVRNLKG